MAKTKQWKTGGEQDKFILKLIKNGKVNKYTKPASLKTNYSGMFSDFSSNVMRNHLNSLKRSNGLYLEGESDDEEDGEDQPTIKMPENSNGEAVNDEVDAKSNSIAANIITLNYPVLCETYKDPDTLNDKVILVISVPSGATNSKIELNEDGTMAIVKCSWPQTMFDMNDLFKVQLTARTIASYHPKILSLQNALQKNRRRIDSTPEFFLKIKLPIKVQTAAKSWTHSGAKREDGTIAIMAEFEGFIKEYSKKSADSTVNFTL